MSSGARPSPLQPVFLGVETGGTKILCRLVDDRGAVLAEKRFATGTPEQAVVDVAACVAPTLTGERVLKAVGVAAFGPIELDPGAPGFGHVLATTKAHWSGFDLHGALAARFQAPVLIDTDVNAAALAEQRAGAGRGLHTVAYLTVGTGIGAGLAIQGRTLKGALHPEIGHINLLRQAGDETPSTCRFHESCAEGLAAGPALQLRLQGAPDAAAREAVLAREADYLAQLCEVLVLAWSPQRIVIGGGVMQTEGLLARTHDKLRRRMSEFGPVARVAANGFLCAPVLEHPGLCGAVELARAATG